MMTSLMRVAGVFSIQTEVHYHLSKAALGFPDSIEPLKELLRLAKKTTACDEIIRLGGLTSLVITAAVQDDSMYLGEINLERMNMTRMLLGKLVLNNENSDWSRLLMAIIKEIRYNKLVILQSQSPTPTSIDRKTIVLQQRDNRIKVYWSIIENRKTAVITIKEAFVPENIFNILLPFMSLTQLDNRDIIQKIIQECNCNYEPELQKYSVSALSKSVLVGKEGKTNTIREIGGISALVSLLLSREEDLRNCTRLTLGCLIEKNSLNQKAFILACSPLLTSQWNRWWVIKMLTCMSRTSEPPYKNEPILRAIIQAGILLLLDEKKQYSRGSDNYEYDLVSYCNDLIQKDAEQKEQEKLQHSQQQQAKEKKRLEEEKHCVIKDQSASKIIPLSAPKVLSPVQEERADSPRRSVIRKSLFSSQLKKSKVAIEGDNGETGSKKIDNTAKIAISTPDSTKEERDRFDASEIPHLHNKWRIPYAALEMKESDRIDGGGFGDVFKGRWKHQPVAIKRAKKNTEPLESVSQAMRTATEDAHREAGIMLGLEHHYIVRFKGLVEEPNRPIMIVMEFVAGGSLYKRLYEDGCEISWQIRLRIAHGLTCGLAFLHNEGILHCDIKSKNVLLTESGEPKWCDFGLSKLKQEVQEGNCLAGTLRWMAPELLVERIHSQATDIWALGMLFFELAACEEPYSDTDEKDKIMMSILEGKGLPIPVECTREAPSFGGLMMLCWKRRNSRPTAEKLEERLRPLAMT